MDEGCRALPRNHWGGGDVVCIVGSHQHWIQFAGLSFLCISLLPYMDNVGQDHRMGHESCAS